jgi:ribosomal protein S27E
VDLQLRVPARRERRRPEEGVLYQALAGNLETFLHRADGDGSRSGLPRFVGRELRAYLGCGQLQSGFARVYCPGCRSEELVAFACKGRAFCPSCGGRRMADTAAHLVDRVFPDVPVRQWVLSLPFPLRYLLARNPELCSKVRRIYVRAIFALLRRKARKLGIETPRPGAVIAIQRFDSALRLNLHFHGLFADGVFTCDAFAPRAQFHPLPDPTDAEVARVTGQIAARVMRLLRREGHLPEPDAPAEDGVDEEPSTLDACQAAAVQGRVALGPDAGRAVARLGRYRDATAADFRPGELCANVQGFSLHAATAVAAGCQDRLESLCRYVLRPPVDEDRLSWTRDGKVLYRLKRPFKDGSTHVVFEPAVLVERLAALVPRPRKNLTTYHGVFAPNASYRERIVPPQAEDDADEPPPAFRTCQHRRKNTPPTSPTAHGCGDPGATPGPSSCAGRLASMSWSVPSAGASASC